MPGRIDIAQIQKAALRGIPLGFRLHRPPHEAHGLLDRILETWLAELGQERLQEPLSYCLKELINNAWKANAKRIYFEEKGLDIRSEADYELGMRDFRARPPSTSAATSSACASAASGSRSASTRARASWPSPCATGWR